MMSWRDDRAVPARLLRIYLTRESKRSVPNFDILLFKKYLWDNIRGSQSFGTLIHND
jgi:hypothetical protein